MEFLNEIRSGVSMHSVSIVMEAIYQGGELNHDGDSKELRWYHEQPEGVTEEHSEFLKSKNLLQKK